MQLSKSFGSKRFLAEERSGTCFSSLIVFNEHEERRLIGSDRKTSLGSQFSRKASWVFFTLTQCSKLHWVKHSNQDNGVEENEFDDQSSVSLFPIVI